MLGRRTTPGDFPSSLFKVGDAVYFAGALDRAGCYAEYCLVDERIAARKPASLSNPQAAALPLTSITAWEMLFDRLSVVEGGGLGQTLLVIGAGGGVGSILVQLARQLTQLRVVATAARPETVEWLKQLGAHHVIDHRKPLSSELALLGIQYVDMVASLTHTDLYFDQCVEVLKPQGKLALIDDPQTLNAMPLKRKSLSLHWEMMFTRSLYETEDMIRQHELLTRVATLIDQGVLKTTMGEHFGAINAANLRRANALIESGKSRGKLVLEGF
ncbi:MAG TPA: zinc-binding alcohol dehydrogenase family protein [Limnobacter sp.]|nr:zinc-binding alcohol dehydrogenase family protein [Limnobacter sp.]